MGESKLQKTRLSRDGDTNLVGEVQAATPFPVLLIQEYLHHVLQFGTFGFVEHTVVGHVRAHIYLPLRGERVLSHLRAAMVAKPMKHGQHPPLDSYMKQRYRFQAILYCGILNLIT